MVDIGDDRWGFNLIHTKRFKFEPRHGTCAVLGKALVNVYTDFSPETDVIAFGKVCFQDFL